MFLPKFVCLCVSNITQKVMDRSFCNFVGQSAMAQTTTQNFRLSIFVGQAVSNQ